RRGAVPAEGARGRRARQEARLDPVRHGPDTDPGDRRGRARGRRSGRSGARTQAHEIKRRILALVFAAAILPTLGGVALAHANYVKSNPASDARLARSPSEVRVTFSETPDPTGSDIAVLLQPSGERKNTAKVESAGDESNTLRTAVPDLPEGGYLVSWTARSAVDGHETKGAFAFVVGNAPLPTIPDIGPSAPPPNALELAGRALTFAVIAFAGLAAGLWATLVSHAAASGDIKIMALDFVHVVAISVWSGGLLAFLVVAFPAVREERALGAMAWRFSLTALTCVAVLVT